MRYVYSLTLLYTAFFFLIFVPSSHAQVVTNKFGMHLAQPNPDDIRGVAKLVNSSGGKWGYVTMVMQEDDRDKGKWQSVLDLCREQKLIPIIRIATKIEGSSWKRPAKEDALEWARFLNSLRWVVKDRYIVLFNEPNHASEWGGAVDIASFTETSYVFAKTIKAQNPDFFIMYAGFDSAAPQSLPQYADEGFYLQTMRSYAAQNGMDDMFDYVSGWSSHSYPNPGFSGSPWHRGRNTVRGYEWELQTLNSLGVQKNLPVFITETGWLNPVPRGNFEIAYTNSWLTDSRIVAVTPFVYNYIGEPFEKFSWVIDETNHRSQYDEVLAIEKTSGDPEIVDTGRIHFDKPREFVVSSQYNLPLQLVNTGQAIWDATDGYYFDISPKTEAFEISHNMQRVLPGESKTITLHIKTFDTPNNGSVSLNMYRKGRMIATAGKWQYDILPLPHLAMHVRMLGKKTSSLLSVEVQIYDKKEELIYKKENILVKGGVAEIESVPGVIFGDYYRIVLVKDLYLPRQNYVKFTKGKNEVRFEPMLPVDFNSDGKFDLQDIGSVVTNPTLFGSIFSQ